MPQQMTRAEFAASIKKQYPVYAKIPDEQLVDTMLAKYPVYRSRISDVNNSEGFRQEVQKAEDETAKWKRAGVILDDSGDPRRLNHGRGPTAAQKYAYTMANPTPGMSLAADTAAVLSGFAGRRAGQWSPPGAGLPEMGMPGV